MFAELVLALKTRVHTGNRRSVGLYCCRLCGGDVFLSVSRHFRLDISALWLGSCFFRSRSCTHKLGSPAWARLISACPLKAAQKGHSTTSA